MSDPAITVRNLGKQYRIGLTKNEIRYRTLRDSLTRLAQAPLNLVRRNGRPADEAATIWALRDVSFDLQRGEVLGVIGRNGAGKSTLLKVLTRITEPTEGYAETVGRVGSLLEVGTGFHPELTGRENVFLNGAILGMRRAEINRKFGPIIDFAGIEKFIDTPVKHYSSGMYVRLAFAVAAHLEPDVLIVDEVLAVGDAAFQEKCLGKMNEVASGGRTVVFVSHNLTAVTNLCSRCLYLEEGRIAMDGEPQAVIEQYLRTVRAPQANSLAERDDRKGNGKLRFTAAALQDASGQTVTSIQSGQAAQFMIEYEAQPGVEPERLGIRIKVTDSNGIKYFYLATDLASVAWETLPEHGRLVCALPEIPLAPGRYAYHLVCELGKEMFDDVAYAGSFRVIGGDYFGTGRVAKVKWGPVLVRHAWRLDGGPARAKA